MIPAVIWSPGSGRLVKLGRPESATFIRKVADSLAQWVIRRVISGDVAPSGSNSVNRRLGCTPETTALAR